MAVPNPIWGTYQSIVYKKCYYEEHQRRSERLLFYAKSLCATVSILSVLVWSISRSMPILWACLIALAQIAQTMINFVPWAQQINALRYLIPGLNALIVDLDADWMVLHYTDNAEAEAFIEKTVQYERRFFDLEDQFTGGVWFPLVKSVMGNAEKSKENYFLVRYFNAEGGEDIAPADDSNGAETRREQANEA